MKNLVSDSTLNGFLQSFSDLPLKPFRHDEGLHLEGKEAQLRSHFFNAANRSRHVLYIQQGESR